jgi:hypothetical protein
VGVSFPHEEHREIGPFWSWAILVLVCLAIVAWGLVNYALIPDRARQWDAGVLPDVPSQSIYSTARPDARAPAAPQMAPLPEARP